MSLRERVVARFDAFTARLEQARSMPQPNRVTYLKNLEHDSKAPLFGVDPHTAEFGLDWASDPPLTFTGGPIPRATIHNVEGIHEDSTPLLPPQKSEIQETRRLNYESATDQRPIPRGKSAVAAWDGVVRNVPKKDFQAARGKSEPTPADLAEKDLKNYPFDFSF